ncbi:hypothetical protein JMJ58_17415 [Haloterrigena salifodinae]|uniref:Uncharacterized protein n=1 Tax=Haloterrigena salifodinae TaxID=2675099 RepID=A0A8T8DYS7_9EURY|nr:hypothetical protein [Haloterrigena salifodinae]QRV14685.1 hypothetical protein JMJ58_17415 [Haloterrigena salifodinae]
MFDGAADPSIMWHRENEEWWLLYTQRRSNIDVPGKAWIRGSEIGVATATDGGGFATAARSERSLRGLPRQSHPHPWGHPHHNIRAAGHADFVQDGNGRWRLVHLGIRQRGPWPKFQDELEEATQDEVREAIERTEADDDDDLVVGS